MNQKGFATILGLCLILAIALVVKGIQESERNHAYATTDFQAEFDLQNAAESGIYMAAAEVKRELETDEKYLPFKSDYVRSPQKKIISKSMISSSGSKIYVDVWCERLLIIPYKVNYAPEPDVANKINDGKTIEERVSYAFFSKAELNSSRAGGKLYRRAFAYVLSDDSSWTVHFMNVTAGGYTYKD